MRPLTILTPLLVIGVVAPFPAGAQATPSGLQMVQALPGTTDADRLADAMRRVGDAPRDLPALLDAGELSFKVGDATAAAAFFKRAEDISPGNARVKAGIARILVNGEHPGEALRYFEAATRGGLPVAAIAADRGLAYDLLGEQERAQRDYRLALREGGGSADETRRRYALSLGISGRRDEALKEIDALLRESDRAAWRARAFILAMSGDQAGAERIATSMMPPGMASGLAPFFVRLASLPAVDRAYAVHFGELGATPARVADARLAPVLPALGADPYAPLVKVAAASTSKKDRKRDKKRGRERDVVVAVASTPPLPTPPAAVTSTAAPVVAAATPVSTSSPALGMATASRSAASVSPAPTPASTPPPAVLASSAAAHAIAPLAGGSNATRAVPLPAITPPLAPATTTPITTPALAPAVTMPITTSSVASTPATTFTPPGTPIAAPALATPALAPVTAPAAVAVAKTDAVVPTSPPPPASVPTPPAMSEDRILAKIVAGDTAPATQVASAAVPSSVPATATLDEAAAVAERNAAVAEAKRQLAAAARDAARKKAAAAKASELKAAAALEQKAPVKGKAELVIADARKAATKKGKPAVADADDAADDKGKKTKSARADAVAAKAAGGKGTKLASADPTATKSKKASKEAPDRKPAPTGTIWVQVAGGAQEEGLEKAWRAAQAKAPALAGRKGYTTPLRATNRVVTGPFKTPEEAQALVNKLTAQGITAFTFTSANGQKLSPVKKSGPKKPDAKK